MKEHSILFVCHECDALQQLSGLGRGDIARCRCCGSRLFRNPEGGIDRPLAFALASLVLYFIANLHPIMTINIAGNERQATLTDSARIFFELGSPQLAAVVWLPTVLIPGFVLFGLLYVLLAVRLDIALPGRRTILAWVGRLLPWGMLDVFLLGVLVALVKLVALADVTLGTGFHAMVILIFLYAGMLASVEPRLLWEHLERQSAQYRGPAHA